MSKKQEIYRDMLLWAIPHIRSVQTQHWWRKAFNRSCLFEAELVHNLYVSLLEEEFVEHDIWFLNHQARYYVEHCNSSISSNYDIQTRLIGELFNLVPEHFRSQLQWNYSQDVSKRQKEERQT